VSPPPAPTPHTPSPQSVNSNQSSLIKTPQTATKNAKNLAPIIHASSTVNVSNYIKELEISEGQLSSCLK
jgi:hypothetical protein